MPPPLSDTVRVKVQYWFDCGHDDDYVYDRTDISRRQIRRMRRYWNRYEEVMKSNVRDGGRFVIFQNEHLNALLNFVVDKSSAYLNEMAWYLFDEFFIVCDEAII